MPTPKKGPRFGRDPAHHRLMMANLAASLFAAEAIVTTEAKAKLLRPYAEKLITKAKKGGLHNRRQVESVLYKKDVGLPRHDNTVTHRLFSRPVHFVIPTWWGESPVINAARDGPHSAQL